MIIRWTPIGTRTRFAQLDYIATEDPGAAERLDEEIENQIDLLADLPGMGRAGRRSGTRELVIVRTPFIAVYRVKGQAVEILRILHHARQWP